MKAHKPQRKAAPHYRMTIEDARREYESGLSTVAGYVYHTVKASRRDGFKLRVPNITEFCKELGITRSAFYKSIAKLKTLGLIGFEIHGAIDLWAEETVVPIQGQLSPNVDNLSPNEDTVSPNEDTDPPQTVEATAFQRSPNSFSTIDQLSYNCLSDRGREKDEQTHTQTQAIEVKSETVSEMESEPKPEGNCDRQCLEPLLTTQPVGERQDDFSAAAPPPVENWREFYKQHKRPPWRLEDGSFHPQMVQAVLQTGRNPHKSGSIYDLPNGQPNLPNINKILRRKDTSALQSNYSLKCDATRELQDLWQLAIDLHHNPPSPLPTRSGGGYNAFEETRRALDLLGVPYA